VPPDTASPDLRDRFKQGLEAPICVTWEVTYGCNLACAHCLSSSGKRDPRELSTEECRQVIDELARVKFSTIGIKEPQPRRPRRTGRRNLFGG
jgi:MoaA/NifB/PqqE/SkfB family radical SAM enzyme